MDHTLKVPSTLEPLDLCCGGRKCPVVTDDDDAVVVTDLEQSPQPIRIAKSDVPRLLEWLQKIAT